MMRLLGVGLVLACLAGGGAWAWVEWQSAQAFAVEGEEREFTVARGASGRELGRQLEEAGLIADQRLWRYHLWRRGGLAAKAGRFSLSPAWPMERIAERLEGAPLPEDEPFTILEGWRLRDTDAALAAKGWIEAGAYLAAAQEAAGYRADFPLPPGTLEGYLYPETYGVIPEGFEVRAFIQRQLDTFSKRFWAEHREEIEASGRSLHELVVMASMLEREEPLPEQRPLVAGILWKRIDRRIPLGVDATSRYLLEQWNDRRAFLVKLRDREDPWNTRAHQGMPPGPIGAPTLDSLVAALRPQVSEYLYYLHDADRILRPSRNGAEHEALRRKYNVY